ncbi:MAG: hypothetical protein WC819_01350 [Parcubacteria group bacterium]|jgi:hypothetical protein
MNIPKQYTSLTYIHDIDWRDIFAVWRSYEAYQKGWEKHWIERGFDSWDMWRRSYIASLAPESRQWEVYRIADPAHDVSLMYGVPSRGWQAKCYDGASTKRIADILLHPMVADNPKMREIEENFPHQTMLTGIVHEGKIVLAEGMHRACVLARMKACKENDVTIALAPYDGEIPSIGKGDRK